MHFSLIAMLGGENIMFELDSDSSSLSGSGKREWRKESFSFPREISSSAFGQAKI